jgi:hypothetical protein
MPICKSPAMLMDPHSLWVSKLSCIGVYAESREMQIEQAVDLGTKAALVFHPPTVTRLGERSGGSVQRLCYFFFLVHSFDIEDSPYELAACQLARTHRVRRRSAWFVPIYA